MQTVLINHANSLCEEIAGNTTAKGAIELGRHLGGNREEDLDARKERTIESQITELKSQIKEGGAVLVKEYVDDGTVERGWIVPPLRSGVGT